ncbi:hypothetical protein EV426DRAFT_620885 [Tirmania nivea]|nr:hypothetical protein EV426DRAFT_620885 [Tirmania nivea]
MRQQILFLTITLILLAIPIAALIYLRHIVALNDYVGVVLGLTDQGTELLGTLEVQFLFYWVPGGILFYLREYLPDSPPPKEGSVGGSGCAPTLELHAARNSRWLPFQYRRIPHSKTSSSLASHNITTGRMLKNVFLNHIYILLAYTFILGLVPSPFTHTAATLPSLTKMAADTIIAVIIGDILTYLLHRKFHTSPLIYKHIHSIHHKYRESNALAAHYVHPLEAVLMNWMCIWAPIAVMGWVGKYAEMQLESGTGIFSWWGYFGFRWVTEGVHVVEWLILWSGVLFWSVVVHGGVEPVWIQGSDSDESPGSIQNGSGLGGINSTGSHRGEEGKSIPRWNLLKRHDLHHEVGGGPGRVQAAVDLKGRPRRWGNFAPFWWVDAIFGTEIECLNHPRKPSGTSRP